MVVVTLIPFKMLSHGRSSPTSTSLHSSCIHSHKTSMQSTTKRAFEMTSVSFPLDNDTLGEIMSYLSLSDKYNFALTSASNWKRMLCWLVPSESPLNLVWKEAWKYKYLPETSMAVMKRFAPEFLAVTPETIKGMLQHLVYGTAYTRKELFLVGDTLARVEQVHPFFAAFKMYVRLWSGSSPSAVTDLYIFLMNVANDHFKIHLAASLNYEADWHSLNYEAFGMIAVYLLQFYYDPFCCLYTGNVVASQGLHSAKVHYVLQKKKLMRRKVVDETIRCCAPDLLMILPFQHLERVVNLMPTSTETVLNLLVGAIHHDNATAFEYWWTSYSHSLWELHVKGDELVQQSARRTTLFKAIKTRLCANPGRLTPLALAPVIRIWTFMIQQDDRILRELCADSIQHGKSVIGMFKAMIKTYPSTFHNPFMGAILGHKFNKRHGYITLWARVIQCALRCNCFSLAQYWWGIACSVNERRPAIFKLMVYMDFAWLVDKFVVQRPLKVATHMRIICAMSKTLPELNLIKMHFKAQNDPTNEFHFAVSSHYMAITEDTDSTFFTMLLMLIAKCSYFHGAPKLSDRRDKLLELWQEHFEYSVYYTNVPGSRTFELKNLVRFYFIHAIYWGVPEIVKYFLQKWRPMLELGFNSADWIAAATYTNGIMMGERLDNHMFEFFFGRHTKDGEIKILLDKFFGFRSVFINAVLPRVMTDFTCTPKLTTHVVRLPDLYIYNPNDNHDPISQLKLASTLNFTLPSRWESLTSLEDE